MRVRIFVLLKEGVLDPQGKCDRALAAYVRLRAKSANVRAGKYLELEVEAAPRAVAGFASVRCATSYWRTPVIEDYRVEIEF